MLTREELQRIVKGQLPRAANIGISAVIAILAVLGFQFGLGVGPFAGEAPEARLRERISIDARDDAYLYNGADLYVYSDDHSTQKFKVDGATGDVTSAGAQTFTGLLTANGGLSAAGTTIASSSGNTVVSGTLTVTGTTALIGAPTATGLLTANGGLSSAGTTIASGTGNTVVSGTLTVTGTTALIGAPTATGLLTANGGLSSAGTTIASGTGNTVVSGTLTVTGTTALIGAPTATGLTTLNGGLYMDAGAFSVADTSGNTQIGGTLNVTGTATMVGVTSIGTFARLVPATAITVTNNGSLTPTGSFQQIQESGDVTITLATAGRTAGDLLIVENLSNQAVVITDTVYYAAPNLGQYDVAQFVYDGTQWVQIGASNN